MERAQLLCALLISFFIMGNLPNAKAQPCVPPQPTGNPGLRPDWTNLDCIYQGQSFNAIINIEPPTTIAGSSIDSIRLDSIGIISPQGTLDAVADYSGLPNGISYVTSNGTPVNTWLPGETGCLAFSGTTNDPVGNYQLGIWVTIWTPNFGELSGELNEINNQVGGSWDFSYYLKVRQPGSPCNNTVNKPCSGTTTLSNCQGSFDDGSGPNDYANNTDCGWLIDPPNASSITLTFNSFHTENTYDEVTVYDGPTTSAPVLSTFSGSSIPQPVTSTGGEMLVRFTTDGSVTDPGWSATYNCNTGGGNFCSGTTTLSNCQGSFDDGSGPNNYANNTDCGWLIDPPNASSITLSFNSFATENFNDEVTVYDGPTTSAPVLNTFSGSTIPQPVTSTGGEMLVRFTTDLSGTDQGWSATYNCNTGGGNFCSGTTTLSNCQGSFNDGSGPSDYANNTDCSWLIDPPNASSITLSFNSFDTENSYDEVTVYDGPTNSAPVLGTFSGSSIPQAVTSTGGEMLVRFTTDGSVTDPGWSATYNCNTGGGNFCSGTTTLSNCPGTFDDGSGPNNYANNTDCAWVIDPPNANSITLSFNSFATENFNDEVTVYDGLATSAPVLGTFSGSSIPQPVTSTGGEMLVLFRTDLSGTDQGWSAQYSCDTSGCPPLFITTNSQDETCNNNNGSVSVSVSNGEAPYNYTWSNGASGSSISGLSAGTYSVIITDANGCSTTESVTINSNNQQLNITTNTQNTTCNESNGSISASVNNGSAPYTFEWSNGESGSSINNLSAGTYYLTVQDGQGCTSTTSAQVVAPGAPTLFVNKSDVTCMGEKDGSVTVSASGGQPPYSYNWSNGITGQTVSGLEPGYYSVTVNGGNNCPSSASVIIEQGDSLSISASTSPAGNGNNGAIQLQVGGGTPPYTYDWDNGMSGQAITGLSSGQYTVTVTDNNGCSQSESIPLSDVGLDEEISGNQHFEIYPNPTSGKANMAVEFAKPSDLQIAIFDVYGKIIYEENMKQTKQYEKKLDLQGQESGVYFVKVTLNDKTITKKLVVNR